MRTRSLNRTVFSTLLVFSLAVVVLFAALASGLLYQSHEDTAQRSLAAGAEAFATRLNQIPEQDQVALARAQLAASERVTLIDPEGNVLYDSVATGDLENHADRPEVQAAGQNGEAVVSRYSSTLKTDLVYAAVKLDDGSTVRLAEERQSYFAFIGGVAVPLVALLGAVVIADVYLARRLTRRIMQPIDRIDVDKPLASDVYREMQPLLVRIDDLRNRMSEQNAALAAVDDIRREFSANVSHELKTPLTVISGYAELLRNGMVAPSDQNKVAGKIYDEAQNMRALVDDVLTISRLEEASEGAHESDEEVDLAAAAQAATDRLAPRAEEADVRVECDLAPAVILGNRTYSEQMFYNLIDNAIRYNDAGGHVRVRVAKDGQGRAVAQVSDDGMGIPGPLHEKIFERFYRVDASRSKSTGGTGLGLAIVKHAVQYQGGTIEVDSAVGRGTTFTLSFPTVADRRATLARHEHIMQTQ